MLYNALNFSVGVMNDTNGGPAMNRTFSVTVINTFLCPSSTPPGWNFTSATAPLGQYRAPGNSYFASVGSCLEFADQQNAGPPNGPFPYYGTKGHSRGIRDITDGTSNTVGFGEWKIGSGNATKYSVQDVIFIGSGPSGTARNNGTYTMPNPKLVAGLIPWLAQCAQTAQTGGGRGAKSPTLGETWAFGMCGYTQGNLLVAPNPKYPNCSTNGVNTIEDPGVFALSSFHPGGANVLMLDGSVKFLKDSTNNITIWASARSARAR